MTAVSVARHTNRARIAALALASLLVYWLALSALSVLVVWMGLARAEVEWLDVAGTLIVIGLVLALVGTTWVLGRRVASITRATIRGLGAEVSEGDGRWQHLVDGVASSAGVRAPTFVVLDDDAANLLTVGFERSTTIVVTTGLLDGLAPDELEALLASEVWAVRRLDVALRSALVALLHPTIELRNDLRDGWDWGGKFTSLWTWPAWRIADQIRRSIGRDVELGADDQATADTRRADPLRRALTKLRDDELVVGGVTRANAAFWVKPVPNPEPPEWQRPEGSLTIFQSRPPASLSLRPALEARIDHLTNV